jgi:3-methyladenine DNA glycosylase AlkD
MPRPQPTPPTLDAALAALRALADPAVRAGLPRYGIPNARAIGVRMADIQALAKTLGRHPPLAEALWETGIYEARLLAAFVAEPRALPPATVERWLLDLDSWAICDTLCFHLFDRAPEAWDHVVAWASRPEEFVRRAAFALLAALALHDKTSPEARFLATFPRIQAAADDPRDLVKKGVSWALRSIGHRSPGLHAEALALAQTLRESESAPARWIGRDAQRDLNRPAVLALATRKAAKKATQKATQKAT